MPYQWNAERERTMLLLAVSAAKLKPSAPTWTAVAELLGEGLTPSAVSQKYYKLRKETLTLRNGHSLSSPPTPTERKGITDSKVKKTPTRRPKRSVKAEGLDGEQLASGAYGTELLEFPFYVGYDPNFVPESLSPCGHKQMTAESGPTLHTEGK